MLLYSGAYYFIGVYCTEKRCIVLKRGGWCCLQVCCIVHSFCKAAMLHGRNHRFFFLWQKIVFSNAKYFLLFLPCNMAPLQNAIEYQKRTTEGPAHFMYQHKVYHHPYIVLQIPILYYTALYTVLCIPIQNYIKTYSTIQPYTALYSPIQHYTPI